jgi:hypothetical protein
VRAAFRLKEFSDERAVVGVVWSGAIPHFSGRQAIDPLGKTDRRIAREPMDAPEGRGSRDRLSPRMADPHANPGPEMRRVPPDSPGADRLVCWKAVVGPRAANR